MSGHFLWTVNLLSMISPLGAKLESVQKKFFLQLECEKISRFIVTCSSWSGATVVHIDCGHPCSHNLRFVFSRAGRHSHDCCLIRKPVTPFSQDRVHISALLKVEWLSVHKWNKDQHSFDTEHSQKRLRSSWHWLLCAMNHCEQKVFTPFATQFVCCANTTNNLLSETFCALLHVYKMIRDASL